MGLPDMLRASKIKHPPLIKPVINKVKSTNVNSFYGTVPALLPVSG